MNTTATVRTGRTTANRTVAALRAYSLWRNGLAKRPTIKNLKGRLSVALGIAEAAEKRTPFQHQDPPELRGEPADRAGRVTVTIQCPAPRPKPPADEVDPLADIRSVCSESP